MLPNCPLSLADPNTEKVKNMTFILSEAEKSDLIFCCQRPFAFISTCFLHICFSLSFWLDCKFREVRDDVCLVDHFIPATRVALDTEQDFNKYLPSEWMSGCSVGRWTTVAFSKQTLSQHLALPRSSTAHSQWLEAELAVFRVWRPFSPPIPTPGKACSHPKTSEREWYRLRTVPLRLAGHQVSVGSSNSWVPCQSGVGKGEMLGWAWRLEERFGHHYQMT